MHEFARHAISIFAVLVLMVLPAASLGALLGYAFGASGGAVASYWGAWGGGLFCGSAVIAVVGLEIIA